VNSTCFCPTRLTTSFLTLFAGPNTPNPIVSLLQCPLCHARYYGTPLLCEPACPACGEGRLQEVATWDLTTEPWGPLLRRGDGELP
jgi:hypothetical protein